MESHYFPHEALYALPLHWNEKEWNREKFPFPEFWMILFPKKMLLLGFVCVLVQCFLAALYSFRKIKQTTKFLPLQWIWLQHDTELLLAKLEFMQCMQWYFFLFFFCFFPISYWKTHHNLSYIFPDEKLLPTFFKKVSINHWQRGITKTLKILKRRQ